MKTYVWTVIEHDEDDVVHPWATSFRTERAAMERVELSSKQFEVAAHVETPIHFLPTNHDEIVACAVNPDTSWLSWTITRTELED